MCVCVYKCMTEQDIQHTYHTPISVLMVDCMSPIPPFCSLQNEFNTSSIIEFLLPNHSHQGIPCSPKLVMYLCFSFGCMSSVMRRWGFFFKKGVFFFLCVCFCCRLVFFSSHLPFFPPFLPYFSSDNWFMKLLIGGKCITLSSETTILEAVQTLSTNNILAAPVVNTDASSPKRYTCVEK